MEENLPAFVEPEPDIETDLVIPPKEETLAKKPGEVTDPSYVPATSGAELEEVGGFRGWWDRPGHWGTTKEHEFFGPTEKVTDRAVLEVLTRQALIEALTLANDPRPFSVKLPHPCYLKRVLRRRLIAGGNGEATLKPKDMRRIISYGGSPAHEDLSEERLLSPDGAREYIKTCDPSWKKLKVEDPTVKFWFGRRIQQLTGHIICDFKLLGLTTPASIINHLAQPPKHRKLVEEINAKGALAELPNVRVFPKRVTSVDKEKEVGRWKIIEKELKLRGLPVFGQSGHAKMPFLRWLVGRRRT